MDRCKLQADQTCLQCDFEPQSKNSRRKAHSKFGANRPRPLTHAQSSVGKHGSIALDYGLEVHVQTYPLVFAAAPNVAIPMG
jgi:hypothetical protein